MAARRAGQTSADDGKRPYTAWLCLDREALGRETLSMTPNGKEILKESIRIRLITIESAMSRLTEKQARQTPSPSRGARSRQLFLMISVTIDHPARTSTAVDDLVQRAVIERLHEPGRVEGGL